MIKRATGCKGTYALMKLPGHDRIMQTLPDSMHTVKDAIERDQSYYMGGRIQSRLEWLRFQLEDLIYNPWKILLPPGKENAQTRLLNLERKRSKHCLQHVFN